MVNGVEERPFLSVNFSSRAAPCTTHNALIPTGMTIAVAGTTIAVAGMSIDVAGMTIAVVGMSIAVVGMTIAVAGTNVVVAGMSIAVVETAVSRPPCLKRIQSRYGGRGNGRAAFTFTCSLFGNGRVPAHR